MASSPERPPKKTSSPILYCCMTSSPERTPKKTPTVALAALACLSVAIATVVNTCYSAYSMHVTVYTYNATLYRSLLGTSGGEEFGERDCIRCIAHFLFLCPLYKVKHFQYLPLYNIWSCGLLNGNNILFYSGWVCL
jgi:hypothetical protein